MLIFRDGIGAARKGEGGSCVRVRSAYPNLASQLSSIPVSTQPRQPTRLGDYILDRMAARGMTQQQDLANAAGLSQPAVSRLIYTQTKPRPDTLNAVARALRVDPNELMRFAYDLSAEPTPDPVALHPTAQRLNDFLGDQSPLTSTARARLDAVITAMLDAEAATPPAVTPRTRRKHTA